MFNVVTTGLSRKNVSALFVAGAVLCVQCYAGEVWPSGAAGLRTARVAAESLTTGVQAGTEAVTATADDVAGASTMSAPVTATVSGSPASESGGGDGGNAPPPHSADIGWPAIPGHSTYSAGAFTIAAAGRDIWDASDQFHFVYQAVTGDADITARVVSLTNSNPWAKAGVMFRESLTGESHYGFVALTPGMGYAFQLRLAPNDDYSYYRHGGEGSAPGWIRLVRRGDRFEAFRSSSGSSWTSIGADTIAMGATVYVGLAVTSHDPGQLTTAVIDQVVVNTRSSQEQQNTAPILTLTNPTAGAAYMAPATITLSADADDPDGEIARVDFFADSELVATALAAPYTLQWTDVGAGTHTVRAVAYDSSGASTTSAPVTVTVSAGTLPGPRWVAFTASADHASVTSYVLNVFRADANSNTGTPVATSDLGKPAPDANNVVSVDRFAFFGSLAPGNYSATVTAISADGETPSAAVAFAR